MIGDFAPYLADDEMEYGEPKVKQINDLMPSCIFLYPAILDEIDPPYEGPVETINMDISKLNIINV